MDHSVGNRAICKPYCFCFLGHYYSFHSNICVSGLLYGQKIETDNISTVYFLFIFDNNFRVKMKVCLVWNVYTTETNMKKKCQNDPSISIVFHNISLCILKIEHVFDYLLFCRYGLSIPMGIATTFSPSSF